ncbi:hypothetical protein M3Y97_00187400 [Aphelenchoides bicaudatus]|nr:hypothetical protein M3Y97_00187400 [Aphelenchoides bicaudatus]
MSINILFEQKPKVDRDVYQGTLVTKAYGYLCGSEVIVDDPFSIHQLVNNGFYGSMLGQRMNFCNNSCFPPPDPLEKDEDGEPITKPNYGAEWLMKTNFSSQNRLYLCAEEVIYLVKTNQLEVGRKTIDELWNNFVQRDGEAFKKRYTVYELLRSQGWTVRSGINFSGDYCKFDIADRIYFNGLALYKENPKTCHASAIVQIVPDLKAINSETTVAMRRSLKNVKKALLLVILHPLDGQDWTSVSYDSRVQIETYHTKTPLAARKIEVLNDNR